MPVNAIGFSMHREEPNALRTRGYVCHATPLWKPIFSYQIKKPLQHRASILKIQRKPWRRNQRKNDLPRRNSTKFHWQGLWGVFCWYKSWCDNIFCLCLHLWNTYTDTTTHSHRHNNTFTDQTRQHITWHGAPYSTQTHTTTQAGKQPERRRRRGSQGMPIQFSWDNEKYRRIPQRRQPASLKGGGRKAARECQFKFSWDNEWKVSMDRCNGATSWTAVNGTKYITPRTELPRLCLYFKKMKI